MSRPIFLKALIISLLTVFSFFEMTVKAQYEPDTDPLENSCADFYNVDYKYLNQNKGLEKIWGDFTSWCSKNNVATKLDAGITLSSFGLGIEAITPATKWADLRAGIDWTPRINVPLQFNLNTFSDGIPTGNFAHVQEMLYNLTGIYMDETVKMRGRTSMVNFKFMVDVYPLQNNRHWHATAGFYAGTSMIADAINDKSEKPTLVGLNIYNRAYDYFTNVEDIFNVPIGGGAYMDPDMVERLQKRFSEYGNMGIQIGDFKDGSPYLMQPAPDGSISAKAYVNHFKPYLGAGYATDLDPQGKWHLGVDIGAIFWGGAPKVINHDWKTGKDIDFTKELVNIRGKVGTYMGVVKALPVFPLLSVKLSYSIF